MAACPDPTATHAPVNAPVTMRAISPGAAVRLAVVGSLSRTSSTAASNVKTTTDGSEPIKESGRSSLSQPRYAAHAVAAGAVSQSRPPHKPRKKAKDIRHVAHNLRHAARH